MGQDHPHPAEDVYHAVSRKWRSIAQPQRLFGPREALLASPALADLITPCSSERSVGRYWSQLLTRRMAMTIASLALTRWTTVSRTNPPARRTEGQLFSDLLSFGPLALWYGTTWITALLDIQAERFSSVYLL